MRILLIEKFIISQNIGFKIRQSGFERAIYLPGDISSAGRKFMSTIDRYK